jgi:formimidoylglutamase
VTKSENPIPYTRAGVWPELRPGRFAETIRCTSAEGCQMALIGLPDDTGVRLNGGRPGAAQGPSALRAALASFGTTWDGLNQRSLAVRVFDAGDVESAPGEDEAALLATHARVEAAVSAVHELGLLPVCIGGGHDLSLPSISALSKREGKAVGGINVDAHLDVRPRVGSGMAFRRLIEGGFVDPRRFVTFGVGRFVNDESDAAWLAEQGGSQLSVEHAGLPDLRPKSVVSHAVTGGEAAFLSVDLDALDASALPGVSAPNPAGLSVSQVAALVEAAAISPGIRHFDLMELSPPWDPSGRSARVAAYLLLCFLAGFERRR